MINMEMFANFDIRFWATDGIVSKLRNQERTSNLNRPRKSWKGHITLPAVAAVAAMSFQVSNAEVAIQTSVIRQIARTGPIVDVERDVAGDNANALSNFFEEKSKELMAGLQSGKLPHISADTLSAAREASKRHVSLGSVTEVPEWIIDLATKANLTKD
jgi:hypothetical protein